MTWASPRPLDVGRHVGATIRMAAQINGTPAIDLWSLEATAPFGMLRVTDHELGCRIIAENFGRPISYSITYLLAGERIKATREVNEVIVLPPPNHRAMPFPVDHPLASPADRPILVVSCGDHACHRCTKKARQLLRIASDADSIVIPGGALGNTAATVNAIKQMRAQRAYDRIYLMICAVCGTIQPIADSERAGFAIQTAGLLVYHDIANTEILRLVTIDDTGMPAEIRF